MSTCPENLVCLTWEEYDELIYLLDESGLEYSAPTPESIGDVEAVANFTWQLLFLNPLELAYIGLPMGVLAFYGLSIYAMFRYIQKKFD